MAVGETSASVGPIGLQNSRLARWSMYAIVAFPLVDYALRHGPGPLHLLGVVWDKVLLLMMVILACSRYIRGYRPQWFQWNKFAGWFILLGLGVMFAGMASPGVSVAGFKMDVYYMLFAFLIPFLVDREDVPKLLHAGAILAILIAIHGIYQYVTKAPVPRGWTDVGETVRSRVYSVLQSPNELGSYMALMTPLLAGLALYETDKWRKVIYAVGVPLCGLTMLLTFTRAAWVALGFAVFIMAVLFERRLLIALVVFVAVLYFLPPIHHRISDLLSPVYWLKSSQSGRIFRWVTAFDKMGTNPLFGIGTGQFGGAVASQAYGAIYSDNYYAKILGRDGLGGIDAVPYDAPGSDSGVVHKGHSQHVRQGSLCVHWRNHWTHCDADSQFHGKCVRVRPQRPCVLHLRDAVPDLGSWQEIEQRVGGCKRHHV